MARRPAPELARLTVRIPVGSQGIWALIRELRIFLPADLTHSRLAADPSTIADYCRRLTRAGVLERAEDGLLTLVRDQPEAPRLRRDGSPAAEQGRGQEQMWRAMKMLAEFDALDLAAAASTDEVRVKPATATAYLKHLKAAGYLMVICPAQPGRGRAGGGAQARYRLKPGMNTGPLAPQIETTDYVYDPNTGRVMTAGNGES
jgi:hypothetical protein